MRIRDIRLTCAAALLLCPVAAGQDSSITERLDRAVLEAGLGQFWGAVLVAREGKVLLAKGYGYATEELRPITDESLFDIGSISKMFTAAAILKLAEADRLNIDDPLSKYLDVEHEAADQITLRHLLNHTSGKNDYAAIKPIGFEDRDEAVRHFIESAPESEPGEQFSYCNSGYVVLAAIIEQVSGEPFERHIREEILIPAGMLNSGLLDGAGLDRSKQTIRVVQPNGGRGRRGLLLDKRIEPWGWGLKGAGGIVTSLRDLLHWDRAIANGTLLSEESMAKWMTPEKGDYAFGWRKAESDLGQVYLHHAGSTRGYVCELRRYPAEDTVIAVLGNENARYIYPGWVAGQLAEVLWPSPDTTITATLDFTGFELTEWKSIVLEEDAGWRLERSDAGGLNFIAGTADGTKSLFTISMNDAAGAQLARRIRGTLANPVHVGEDANGIEIGIYGYLYNAGEDRHEFSLASGLSWRVEPYYSGMSPEGERIRDDRVVVILEDANMPGAWPVMMKLGDEEATDLAEQLEELAAQGEDDS